MLSVIVPCQEDGNLLSPTLSSLFKNIFPTKGFEVLVVRGSHQPIPESVKHFPIHEYQVSFNGSAKALNFGITKAEGDTICTTKPGCIVASDWLEEIDSFFQHNPSIDGVGGPVLPFWSLGTKVQRLASQIFSEEQSFPDSVVVPEVGSFQALFHATNSAFRRNVLESIKFDEFFRYDYDFDACFRMLLRGNRLVFNPKMKVRYIFPSSLRNILARYYYWGLEKAMLRKRYSSKTSLNSQAYPFYNAFRSLLQPAPLISTKKMLRFVQHVAYTAGVMNGYSRAAF
jgi:biofilm PGA synthesis N-glycosyltransferase PgaC